MACIKSCKQKVARLWCKARQQYLKRTQLRLTVYFLVVIVPLIVVSLYANFRTQQIINDETDATTNIQLDMLGMSIDDMVKSIESLTYDFARDENTIAKLEMMKFQASLSPVDVSELLDYLETKLSPYAIFSHITIIDVELETIFSTKIGARRESRSTIQRKADVISNLLDHGPVIKNNSESLLYGSPARVSDVEGVSFIRKMDDDVGKNAERYLFATIKKSVLNEKLRPLQRHESVRIDLYSKQGTPITSVGREAPSGDCNEGCVKVKYTDDYHWRIVYHDPTKQSLAQTESINDFTVLINIVSVILAILIAWGVYTRIVAPLDKLTHAMRNMMRGNYDVRLENDREDEFGFLMAAYNQMAAHQKELIEGHYEQQLQLTQAELKFLQSQINPHFMYNTLDSIYWMAKHYDADEIGDMVLNLAAFYRASLHKGASTCTVEETITQLNYYVRVQQIRFLDKFEVKYDISDDSKFIPLLKLLLQPLVENAILHGLNSNISDGKLTISSRTTEDRLILRVEDNGNGIAPNKLAMVQDVLYKVQTPTCTTSMKQVDDGQFYGLRNVMSRVKMVYGNDATMNVHSEENQGTSITVELPLEQCWAAAHYK
ncbi:cache domain-containing sensor histidine kinase [Paenibacillus assamensis]|uniref:cache domain-containing sensor histidine kinase n=1 Tax=Paenibacillus assamensis TaxID=311244 RepID=UPI0003F705E7|nr:sensor histidine kinase [Paenibacillus assamensis]